MSTVDPLNREYHTDGGQPPEDRIFVFGSNLSGIHGGGGARAAHKFYGAEWGVGVGLTGRSYALPTVKHDIEGPLPLGDILTYAYEFCEFTRKNLDKKFFVTRVGCVLARYSDKDIAPMFISAVNCSFAEEWKEHLEC